MKEQIIVDLSKVLSPSYAQVVWGVGYTKIKLKENAPLKNGNPTVFLHEYDFTLRQQTLPTNIMEVCKAAFSWISEISDDSSYFPYDYASVMSITDDPFEGDPWVNSCANKTIYPNLTAVRDKIFVPEKVKNVNKLVKAKDKYVYLLEYFDGIALDLIRNPGVLKDLKMMCSSSTTSIDILRKVLYNVPPQALWGDCFSMAPMGVTHVLLALQKAGELVEYGEWDLLKRYFWAVEAQKYATVNRFSSSAMRTCYQAFIGKAMGTSLLNAGGFTADALAAIKLHGVAPYSRVMQPLIFNDGNSFADFALNNNWDDLQHRTQLELAEFYAKFAGIKSLKPALDFGREYCDLERLRMIAFISENQDEKIPRDLPAEISELLSQNQLPGFGYFPKKYKSGDAPVPNPAVIELVKGHLQRGFPICCGGTISNYWVCDTQKYGCVPPDPLDKTDTYDGGHETFIVGMCERDDKNPEIKQLFDYWQDRAAQVEDENAVGFADLPKERQEVYNKERYLLFIMNSWDYWSNTKLFLQGPTALNFIPKSKAKHEKSIWLNERENEQNLFQLGTTPLLGATGGERAKIPSHVYILPGSYLFYLTTMTVILNPTYLSADYDEKDFSPKEGNATHALLKNIGVDNIHHDDTKHIGIQIDPGNNQ